MISAHRVRALASCVLVVSATACDSNGSVIGIPRQGGQITNRRNCVLGPGNTAWANAGLHGNITSPPPEKCPYNVIGPPNTIFQFAADLFGPKSTTNYSGTGTISNMVSAIDPVYYVTFNSQSRYWQDDPHDPNNTRRMTFSGSYYGGHYNQFVAGPWAYDTGSVTVTLVNTGFPRAAVEMSGSATITPGYSVGTLIVPSQIVAQVPAALRAYTTVDTNAYHFSWKVDGLSVPGNDDADLSQTFAVAGSHTVTAYAQALVGVDTISSTITVLLNLSLFGASPVKQGCPVTFTSSLYGQTGAVTYTWRVNGVATGPNASTWDTTVNWTGTKTVSVDALDAQGHFASKSMSVTGTTTGTCPFSVSR